MPKNAIMKKIKLDVIALERKNSNDIKDSKIKGQL